MGGISDILKKTLNPGVHSVPCVPTDGERGLPSQSSAVDLGTREKLDGVPGVPTPPHPDPLLGHVGHMDKNQVSLSVSSVRTSNEAISEDRDTWDTGDTQKTHFHEKSPDTSQAERGLVQIEDPRLFSNGKPTFASLADLPHIRVYAWCLANLRFVPLLSAPTDLSKVAEECQLSLDEARDAFEKLIKDNDLLRERDRRGNIYYLAPIRWGADDQG